MPIPTRSIMGISFDYGHVLGGLDLDDLAARLMAFGIAKSPSVSEMASALPDAYRAHDAAILRGDGHEAGWRALIGVLVATANPATAEAKRARAVDALWDAQPERNLWRRIPAEARTLLQRLTNARVPMVITSNSEGRVAELLTEVGIAHHFVAILDSGLLGYAKPDARIFHLAANKLGVDISSIVHVGDSETADVVGAKGAGAWAIRFEGFVPGWNAKSVSDERAVDFQELQDILARVLVNSLG